jgi:tetratricopeptide (TPR) repeat protein
MTLPAPPDRVAYFLTQGREALGDKRWLEAEAAYRAVLQLDPQNWAAMCELAQALRAMDRKDEAAQLERTAAGLAPASEQPKKSRAARPLGILELLAIILNPGSLGVLLLASITLPLLPWIALAYYRVAPGRLGSPRNIIGWIFQGVRAGRLGPFVLGFAAGLAWVAILGLYTQTETGPGLRVFTGIIALFTVLCAARIVIAVAAGRAR